MSTTRLIKVTMCNDCPYVMWIDQIQKHFCLKAARPNKLWLDITKAIEDHVVHSKCPLEKEK